MFGGCGSRGRLTEVQLLLVEDVFVEEDDTGAHGNPDTARALYQLPFLLGTFPLLQTRLTQHRGRGGWCSEEEQASRAPG
jgi:hypothetical protein